MTNDNYKVKKTMRIIRKVIFYSILTAFSLLQLLPFWLKIVEALQPEESYFATSKIYMWPLEFRFSNFKVAWQESKLLEGYINTIKVTVLYVGLSAFVSMLLGFVFSKINFRGRNFIFLMLLSTMMIPGEITMISNYELINTVFYFLLDSHWAIILPGLVNIFGIFLVKQYLESVPNALFEAATIDGAGTLKQIFYIAFPLAIPALATYAILTTISTWNDYLWPQLILGDASKFTIQLKLMFYNGTSGTSRDQIMKSAGLILVTFPIVLVYCVLQRHFIKGIAISGMK